MFLYHWIETASRGVIFICLSRGREEGGIIGMLGVLRCTHTASADALSGGTHFYHKIYRQSELG